MAEQIFNPGDIVMLRSGGPSMTVSSITDNSIHVVYFNPVNGKIERESFYRSSLRNATTQPQNPSGVTR